MGSDFTCMIHVETGGGALIGASKGKWLPKTTSSLTQQQDEGFRLLALDPLLMTAHQRQARSNVDDCTSTTATTTHNLAQPTIPREHRSIHIRNKCKHPGAMEGNHRKETAAGAELAIYSGRTATSATPPAFERAHPWIPPDPTHRCQIR